jgi:ParB family chromosome partitioning protein
LAEIDENIQRSDLTEAQEVKALARRKEIYESLHPETKHVTKRGGPGRGKKTTDKMAVVSFTDDTAAQTGKSPRQVRRDVAIGEAIPDDVADAIEDTPVADNKSQLEKLSKLPEDEQREVAEKLQSGEIDRVPEEQPEVCPDCGGVLDFDGDCPECYQSDSIDDDPDEFTEDDYEPLTLADLMKDLRGAVLDWLAENPDNDQPEIG